MADSELVRVSPASGTTACLGMLSAMYLDLRFRRAGLAIARPLGAGVNAVAMAVTRRSARLHAPGRGGLFADFHVVAGVPR
jgi:hypothetical protein